MDHDDFVRYVEDSHTVFVLYSIKERLVGIDETTDVAIKKIGYPGRMENILRKLFFGEGIPGIVTRKTRPYFHSLISIPLRKIDICAFAHASLETQLEEKWKVEMEQAHGRKRMLFEFAASLRDIFMKQEILASAIRGSTVIEGRYPSPVDAVNFVIFTEFDLKEYFEREITQHKEISFFKWIDWGFRDVVAGNRTRKTLIEQKTVLFERNGMYRIDVRSFNPEQWFWLKKAPRVTRLVYLKSLEGIYPFKGEELLQEFCSLIT
ncbi:MAG: hypothetical protein HXS42_07945 [Theionarchaea archaeon]|nr:hypothetical protein [Theionarchaea archaeon]MBU7039900.1 hypothetical protein [Theionarchaea archaeon]